MVTPRINIKKQFTLPIKLLILGALVFIAFLVVFRPSKSSAATHDVCASGCEFTTIGDALASGGLTSGDTIFVNASYAPAGETYPLNFPSGVDNITIDCQNSGAFIDGEVAMGIHNPYFQGEINMGVGSTIKNCSLREVDLHVTKDSVTIKNNVFDNAPPMGMPTPATPKITTIDITSDGTSAATNFSITDNTNITRIQIQTGPGSTAAPSSGTINGNTIVPYNPVDSGFAMNILGDPVLSPSDVNITNNTIDNHASWGGFFGNLAVVSVGSANNITFDHNIIKSSQNPGCDHCGIVQVGSGANISFINNYITLLPNSTNDRRVIRYQPSGSVSGTIEHNTLVCLADSPTCTQLDLFAGMPGDSIDVSVNYNLFYSFASSPTGQAIRGEPGFGATITMANDYNGFWNLATNLNAPGSGITLGAHSKYINPMLKLGDADSSNDLELVPFSNYLDVNGTQDIGAYSAARRSTIYINSSGSVNYTSKDAGTLQDINDGIRTGDTVEIAAGTYAPFSVTPTADYAGGITVEGQGDSTIIDATSSSDGITLNGLMNSTVKNLKVQNADLTSSTYTITKPIYSYGGHDYNQSDLVGSAPDSALIFKTVGVCEPDTYDADGFDVTTIVGGGTDSWNLALVRVGGLGDARLTVLVPNNVASNASQFESPCSPYDVIAEKWVPNIFTVSNHNFSYNAAAAAAAGITLDPGVTNPPRIDHSTSGYNGIKLVDSNNNVITNVTLSHNAYAIDFFGTSASNTVSESTIADSSVNDVKSESSGDNDLKNVMFERTTGSITGAGKVRVWFKIKAVVKDQHDQPVSGASVTINDAAGSNVATLTTATDGSTPLSDPVIAYVMSNTSLSETNGGYNPHAVTAAASHAQNEVSQNFNNRNQTITVTLNIAAVVDDNSSNNSSNSSGSSPGFPNVGIDPRNHTLLWVATFAGFVITVSLALFFRNRKDLWRR